MLIVNYHGITATWDEDDYGWHVDGSAELQKVFNDSIPSEVYEVKTPYLQEGAQGLALKGLQDRLGADEVTIITRTDPPEEPDPAEGEDN
jgi:hypothetical protein